MIKEEFYQKKYGSFDAYEDWFYFVINDDNEMSILHEKSYPSGKFDPEKLNVSFDDSEKSFSLDEFKESNPKEYLKLIEWLKGKITPR